MRFFQIHFSRTPLVNTAPWLSELVAEKSAVLSLVKWATEQKLSKFWTHFLKAQCFHENTVKTKVI